MSEYDILKISFNKNSPAFYKSLCKIDTLYTDTKNNEVNMAEKENQVEQDQNQVEQNQNNKPVSENVFRHPKEGEPGFDEFMRSLFRRAGSNMLREDEI